MWQTKHFFEVSVWWPTEKGYGGSVAFETLQEAMAERKKILKLGYKDVHIREVTAYVIPETMTETWPEGHPTQKRKSKPVEREN